MDRQSWIQLWREHKGKIVGTVAGLCFALFVIWFGFLGAIFIAICVAIGYLIGKRVDEGRSWKGNIFDWLFPRR